MGITSSVKNWNDVDLHCYIDSTPVTLNSFSQHTLEVLHDTFCPSYEKKRRKGTFTTVLPTSGVSVDSETSFFNIRFFRSRYSVLL